MARNFQLPDGERCFPTFNFQLPDVIILNKLDYALNGANVLFEIKTSVFIGYFF